MKILRVMAVFIVGAFGGALCAGSIYAVAVITIPSLGQFGPGYFWWKEVGLFGGTLGFLAGFFVALFVIALDCGKLGGSIAGGLAGTAISAYGLTSYFLSFGRYYRLGTVFVLLALIPLTIILGMILTVVSKYFHSRIIMPTEITIALH